MKQEYLECHGVKVPKLGLGTWQMTGDTCKKIVALSLDMGYRHIDTAQIYGNEAEVGEGIESSSVKREEIFLTTKVWKDTLSYKEVLETTQESLRKLKTDYVDLLLIHWPNSEFDLKETLKGLIELQEKNKTKFIGVSNFPSSLLKEAYELAPQIICNQVEYHPFLSQNEVLKFINTQDMFLTAYCPLARNKVGESEVLNDIGKTHHKTAGQVSLRWLISQKRVVAIPKTSQKKHLEENSQIFDFELSTSEIEQINSENKTRRLISPDFSPHWDSN